MKISTKKKRKVKAILLLVVGISIWAEELIKSLEGGKAK